MDKKALAEEYLSHSPTVATSRQIVAQMAADHGVSATKLRHQLGNVYIVQPKAQQPRALDQIMPEASSNQSGVKANYKLQKAEQEKRESRKNGICALIFFSPVFLIPAYIIHGILSQPQLTATEKSVIQLCEKMGGNYSDCRNQVVAASK